MTTLHRISCVLRRAATPLAFAALLLAGFLAAVSSSAPVLAQEQGGRPVLKHEATQTLPAADGRWVVWQDERRGPADIFLADLAGGEIRNLTNTPAWEASPDISYPYVVWRDGYAGLGIHGLDIRTGAVFTVTTGRNDLSRPSVSGSFVVWADDREGDNNWNIYAYDITDKRELLLDDSPNRQRDPQIDGNYAVWWDHKESIFLHDLAGGTTEEIHTSGGAQLPVVSAAEKLVVWMQRNGGDWDLRAYDIATGQARTIVAAPGDQETPALGSGLLAYVTRQKGNKLDIGLHVLADGRTFAVTDDSALQTLPAVGENVVVWDDTRHHQRDIFRFDWTGQVPPTASFPLTAPANLEVGAYPPGLLALRWEDRSPDEAGFTIERSVGFTDALWSKLATLPPGTTLYTDTAVAAATTYWYRVRAFNTQGVSDYSNESFNSTIRSVPNANELYLMVLINEARAAPGEFGYGNLAPVPPLAYNPNIGFSARAHSQSILNSQAQFGHCDLANRCSLARAVASGYTGEVCVDNLILSGTGPQAIESAHQAFMDSSGHRASLMDPGYNEFAVGHATTDRTSPAMQARGQVSEVFCRRKGVTTPTVPVGAVTPYSSEVPALFTFAVNFYAPDEAGGGLAPTLAQVVIDGVAYPLALSSGEPWHGTYRYAQELPPGKHTYYFYFEYGDGRTARWPGVGSASLPNAAPEVYLPQVNKN